MKKQALVIAFLVGMGIFPLFSQAYVGITTGAANLRQGPGMDYEVITSLKNGSVIFTASNETQNGFFNIIDVDSGMEGFVHQSLIKLVEEVEISDGGFLIPDQKMQLGGKAAVEIYNRTYLPLSVKLNKETFSFKPNEKRVLYLNPGSCNFIASAPGVLPAIGLENLDSNWQYSWEFYIKDY